MFLLNLTSSCGNQPKLNMHKENVPNQCLYMNKSNTFQKKKFLKHLFGYGQLTRLTHLRQLHHTAVMDSNLRLYSFSAFSSHSDDVVELNLVQPVQLEEETVEKTHNDPEVISCKSRHKQCFIHYGFARPGYCKAVVYIQYA